MAAGHVSDNDLVFLFLNALINGCSGVYYRGIPPRVTLYFDEFTGQVHI